MIRMVDAINTENFGGVPRVTCFTCHQGAPSPKSATSLDVQYGVPPDDPNEIIFPVEPISALPSPDELFEKYIGALGGREQMENLTSFVARGTYSGYDTNLIEVPVEVFAAAPGRRTTVVQALFGESVRTYDGSTGWIASADRPLPLMVLTGDHLVGARMDAILSFPAEIRDLV